LEELLGVLITLSSKHNEKKLLSPQSLLANKHGLDRFNEEVATIMASATEMIR
jgi:hypothetical protein